MNNDNLTIERFYVWEEKNLIGPEKKLESNGESKPENITKKTEMTSVKRECENIGETKKICSKCQMIKGVSSFYKNKEVNDGYHRWCKFCMKEYMKKWKPTTEMIEKYRKRVRERYKERMEIENYREKEKLRKSKNRKTDEYRKYQREYVKNRKIWDFNLKIKDNLRGRIRKVLKSANAKKSKNTLFLTGCNINELKNHIQSQFKEGMTWENYGKMWHIDHIIPCRSFDLTNENEQKKCFHYTNLQPLWCIENYSKGDKLPNGIRARNLIG